MIPSPIGADMFSRVSPKPQVQTKGNKITPYQAGRGLDKNQVNRISPQLNSPKPTSKPKMSRPPAVTSGNPPTLNKTSSFRLGFLYKVAELGELPEEFADKVQKSAAISNLSDILGPLVTGGATLGIAAPVATGLASGALREVLSTPEVEDVEVLRKMERLGLYRRLTEEIRRRAALRGKAQ